MDRRFALYRSEGSPLGAEISQQLSPSKVALLEKDLAVGASAGRPMALSQEESVEEEEEEEEEEEIRFQFLSKVEESNTSF